MITGKRVVAVGLISLGVAVCAAALVAFGIEILRPVVYVAVLVCVATALIGIVGVIAKRIKNDLNE